jgi:hypothetical protein
MEVVYHKLGLVVVYVFDVDGEVKVALQRGRDPEVVGLHSEHV